MAAYSVDLLRRAEADLDEICEYLSQFYPGTVGRFLTALEQALDNAAHNPMMYQAYEWDASYRRIVVQDYLVFYKVDESAKQVKVYRVLHGKRNIPDILEG
jgi:addiction module RelE/StbE family toxin